MATDPMKRLLERISENLETVIDEMDDDEIQEAIRDQIDFPALVAEVLKSDTTLFENLRGKVRELISQAISDIDENYEVGDATLQDHLLQNIDWGQIIPEVVARDEIQARLQEKLKEIIHETLGEIDNEDLLGWEEIAKNINFPAMAEEIIQEKEIRDRAEEVLREELLSRLSDFAETIEITPEFWKSLKIPEMLQELIQDRQLRERISKNIQDKARGKIINIVSGKDIDLLPFIRESPAFMSAFSKAINELMKDPKTSEKLKKFIKEEVLGMESFRSRVMKLFLKH